MKWNFVFFIFERIILRNGIFFTAYWTKRFCALRESWLHFKEKIGEPGKVAFPRGETISYPMRRRRCHCELWLAQKRKLKFLFSHPTSPDVIKGGRVCFSKPIIFERDIFDSSHSKIEACSQSKTILKAKYNGNDNTLPLPLFSLFLNNLWNKTVGKKLNPQTLLQYFNRGFKNDHFRKRNCPDAGHVFSSEVTTRGDSSSDRVRFRPSCV